MDKDIQARVNAAVSAGANPQEAYQRGLALQQQRKPQSVMQGNFQSPNLVSGNGFVSNVANSVARPFVKTGQMVAGSGFEVARALLNKMGSQGMYATDPNTGRAAIQNPFLSDETLNSTNSVGGAAKIIKDQALQSAALASYGIPVGGATKFAGKVIAPGAFTGGALVGGLQAASEDGANAESVLGGAALGGVLGKGLDLLGKGIPKLQKGGQTLEDLGTKSRVGNVKLKAGIGGAESEKAVQKTLGKYGIKGTPQAKYEMLEPTMDRINQAIDSFLNLNPKKISTNELEKVFRSKVVPYVRQGDITLEEALQGFKEYIKNVQDVTPDALNTSKGLFELKKDLQNGMRNIYNKTGDLTSTQKATKAIRDTFDEVLTSLHPEVKQLTLDQSKLYDAVKPLAAQRNTVPTVRALGITIPKGPYNAAVDLGGRAAEFTGKTIQRVPDLSLNGLTKNLISRGGVMTAKPNTQSEMPNQTPISSNQSKMVVPSKTANLLTPEFMAGMEMSNVSESTKKRLRQAYEFVKGSSGQGKLTEKQNAYKAASDGAQYALSLLESGQAQTGPGTRTLAGAKRSLGLTSKQQQDFEGTLSLARGYLLNALSGANVPPSEYERLASLLEIEGANPEVAKQQLRTFIRESQRFLGTNIAPSLTIQQ